MSSTLYKALGNPLLSNIIKDMLAAAETLDIDFFGVGALARNIWYVENNLAPRGTKDVDFGVYVSDKETYQSLKAELINSHGYTASSTNAFCLISPDNIPVDLLPFGEIEHMDKEVITGKGLTRFSFDGFREVHINGLQVINIEGDLVKVCTIPAVVLLKLIAYDDRPEHRLKDPLDIAAILINYPNLETELIWNNYHFLYDQDLTHEDIGTIVLGYEISKLIEGNEALTERVFRMLDAAINLESSLAERMITDAMQETIADKVYQLTLLKRGFNNSV